MNRINGVNNRAANNTMKILFNDLMHSVSTVMIVQMDMDRGHRDSKCQNQRGQD